MTGRRAAAGLLAALALGTATPAAGWNAAGHRLVAALAWRDLDAPTRRTIAALLEAHPARSRRTLSEGGEDAGYAAFLAAAVWPDDLRRETPRCNDTDEAPADDQPDRRCHRDWHYADEPLAAKTPTPAGGRLDQELPRLAALLAHREAPPLRRAEALAWVVHLVADAHQPLHAVSRYDAAEQGDEGGNLLVVETPARRRPRTSLHAYWDDLPGPVWLRGERLDRQADSWAAVPAAVPVLGTVDDWLQESRRIARGFAYAALPGDPPTIDAHYDTEARRIARERVVLAGRRLALLLRRIFG